MAATGDVDAGSVERPTWEQGSHGQCISDRGSWRGHHGSLTGQEAVKAVVGRPPPFCREGRERPTVRKALTVATHIVRLIIVLSPSPKGRANKAQANGLGFEADPILHWQQALQGRNNQALASASTSSGLSRPFRASQSGGMDSSPRPLAWALLARPFGA